MPQPDPLATWNYPSSSGADEPCPCGRPDDAETNMVQCERCLRFYHYTCANVTASIEADDRHFVCVACSAPSIMITAASSIASSRSGRSTAASTRARVALELQRLEEEKEMEKRYLAKKYDILQAQLNEEENGSVKSGRSRRSTQRTQEWVDQTVPTTSTSTGLLIPPGIQCPTGTLRKQTLSVPASETVTTSSELPALNMQLQPAVSSPVSTVCNALVPVKTRLSGVSNVGAQLTSTTIASGLLSEAAGGLTISEFLQRPPPLVPLMDFSISTTQNPDEVMRELFELQQRMGQLELQLQPPVTLQSTLPSTVSDHLRIQGPGLPGVIDRIPTYEFPEEVSSSVSQTCSSLINTTSLSIFDKTPPHTRPVDSINHTTVSSTGPCQTPPSVPFDPSHISTPRFHNTPPSVHTVSATLSPIVSPIVTACSGNAIATSSVPVVVPASFLPYVPASVPSYIPATVPASVPPYIPATVPASVPPYIPATVPASVPPYIPATVPASVPPYIPATVPASVPSYIPATVPASVPPYIPATVPASVPSYISTTVPASVPPYIPATVPASVSPYVPTTVPLSFPPYVPATVPASVSPYVPASFPPYVPATVPASVSPYVPASVQTSVPVVIPTTLPRQLFGGPSSQQLAARQVVPRELPSFSGDPVEWPLFLSSFQNSTELCGYSDGENLMRLQRCLKGNALEAVRSYLMQPSSVPSIIATLRTLYGRPEAIVSSLLTKVRTTPTPKPENLDTLISFGLACKNLCGHLRAAGLDSHLANPILLQELVNKLPANIKLSWSIFKRQQPVVDLSTFGSYMDEIVAAASDVTYSYEAEENRGNKHEKNKPKEKLYVNTHTADNSKGNPSNTTDDRKEMKPKPCPACQKEGHKARDCYSFRNMNLGDRWKLAEERHLCRRCLTSHGRFPCKASTCGENGCEERHHKLLHPGKPQSLQRVEVPRTTSTISVHRQLHPSILFRILPVTLYGNGKAINTYAFLDDGSSTTLLESRMAEELGVKGDVHPLCLQWTNELKHNPKTSFAIRRSEALCRLCQHTFKVFIDIERTEDESELVSLEISERGHSRRHSLKMVHTIKNLNLPVQTLDYAEISKQFSHLEGLPVQSYENVVPTILIGLDNSHLKTTLKRREGSRNEPVASKTRLGWTIYGAINTEADPTIQFQFHICARSPDQELHDLVKEFFSVEDVGTTISPIVESDDDIRARAILERTTVRNASGRFQTGLLWKYDYVDFPSSRPMAERRFQCLERRLGAKPELYEKVREQMKEYQSKGYAHRIGPEEFAAFEVNKTWFLPLNVVVNPKKPNKVRLVWDAAAKVQGQSLNSALLAGPDLLTPLPAVLCPFRQSQIAITGDISEMFHQILIQPEDRSAQLFLWRDHPSQQLEVFAMQVATFGATCSPSAAQYVKNRNAQEFAEQYPRAAEAIVKHHYVDDFLYSVDTTEEAVELAQQVREVHSKAGFHIRNWLSNSSDVLTRVGEKNVEMSKSFAVDKTSSSERVLGMIWKPDSDVFVFQGLFREDMLPLIQGAEVPTKRQALRIVMSIFDPLGLVAVFVVHGKMLIQNIWRSKIGWDERISGELVSQWKRWRNLLQQLEQIQIPRCYFPGSSSEVYRALELHIFVDASEEACAAVAYFRIVEGQVVRCVLVSAKTKVAPLKPMSIPRLELQAAVLGVKLAKSVADNHTVPITRKVFWSDSRTALAWIRSDQRKYRQFVAFRVTEILEYSQVDEWRWIPSRLNVADEATKWGKGPCISSSSRWFQAPAFLYQHPDLWPQQESSVMETVEELRPVHIHRQVAVEQLIVFGRFSKWERIVRAVAYVHRYLWKLRCRIKRQSAETPEWLSQDELRKAESTVYKLIQQDAYEDEIITLTRNQQLPMEQQIRLEPTSKLRKLSPILDEQGVVRMDSRISSSLQLSTNFKFPVILPKGHYGTQLLVNWYHRQYKHQNAETALNEMRQKFHVSEMRAAFRQVRKLCQWCKVYKAVPAVPRMAPLPPARTAAYVRPFSFVGVDYFGPMLIRQGRSDVKRWVAIFTCLTVRAVHLEMAYSLSTESCKLAIRRFVGKRGAPAEIFSDRGTNFVGASNELKKELQQIYPSLASTFTNTDTQWRFNPPSSPHMGGCWERMVRSIKCAMASLSSIRKPTDEVFWTLLVEAESIVNSRPLTYLPIESEAQGALTPNCFLMLSTSGVNQPTRHLTDGKLGAYSSWNICQQLLDQFWSRWIKEYLPTITKRTKWFSDCRPIQAGDLVVVVEEHLRNGWLRGRVLRVFPGRDGRVRSAEVKTASGVVHRPAAKLAVLEVAGTTGVDSQQYGSGDVPNGGSGP